MVEGENFRHVSHQDFRRDARRMSSFTTTSSGRGISTVFTKSLESICQELGVRHPEKGRLSLLCFILSFTPPLCHTLLSTLVHCVVDAGGEMDPVVA